MFCPILRPPDLLSQSQGDAWFKPSTENVHAGVCLRISAGQFRVFPYENRLLEPFELAVRTLNPLVAVKVRALHLQSSFATYAYVPSHFFQIRSAAIHVALGSVCETLFLFGQSVDLSLFRAEDDDAIYLDDETRIQVLDTMLDLPGADKEQNGAFIVRSLSHCVNSLL